MPRRRADASIPWAHWSTDRLLDVPMAELGVSLEGTWLEAALERLAVELDRRGIRFRPHAWLSSEWFSPAGVPGIAVPFYLAHPRLARLERELMLEAEGGSRAECARILRHECGHTLQVAYRLNRRKRWRELFGRSSEPYPELYRPDPASRDYVQHLRLHYAQSHPDEDFAETFAVWLQPRHLWRRRYKGWPALEKLEYVDALMAEIRHEPAAVRSRRKVDPLHRNKQTLRQHYAERLERYPSQLPDVYDADLRRLFTEDGRQRLVRSASSFLRGNRVEIRRLVSRWTGEYQFTLDQVLDDMIRRCRELRLGAVGDEASLRMDFAVLLTVHTMHTLHTRRDWIRM
jgi:hypothetical protein